MVPSKAHLRHRRHRQVGVFAGAVLEVNPVSSHNHRVYLHHFANDLPGFSIVFFSAFHEG